MRSPERPAFLRQGGIAGVVAATPLGVFTVATSIGDGGRQAILIGLDWAGQESIPKMDSLPPNSGHVCMCGGRTWKATILESLEDGDLNR
jgi:hypothetical protein